MSEKEQERMEEQEKAVQEARALAESKPAESNGKRKRKKRNLNLSRDQKRQIKYLRVADRVGIIFGSDSIRVSRADSIRLVETGKAKVVVGFSKDEENPMTFCTVYPK